MYTEEQYQMLQELYTFQRPDSHTSTCDVCVMYTEGQYQMLQELYKFQRPDSDTSKVRVMYV